MRRGNIRFDDPDDPNKSSSVCIELTMRLMLLDFTRRAFERKGDETSLRRAEELRKFFKQTVWDSVTLVRSMVPEDLLTEYTSLSMARIRKHEQEQKERKLQRRLARQEGGA